MRESAERSYRREVNEESASDETIYNDDYENRETRRFVLTAEQLRKIYEYVSDRVPRDAASLTGIFRADQSGGRWAGYVYRALEHFALLDDPEIRELLAEVNEELVWRKVWRDHKVDYLAPQAAEQITRALRKCISNLDELFDIIYPKKRQPRDNTMQKDEPNNVIQLFS